MQIAESKRSQTAPDLRATTTLDWNGQLSTVISSDVSRVELFHHFSRLCKTTTGTERPTNKLPYAKIDCIRSRQPSLSQKTLAAVVLRMGQLMTKQASHIIKSGNVDSGRFRSGEFARNSVGRSSSVGEFLRPLLLPFELLPLLPRFLVLDIFLQGDAYAYVAKFPWSHQRSSNLVLTASRTRLSQDESHFLLFYGQRIARRTPPIQAVRHLDATSCRLKVDISESKQLEYSPDLVPRNMDRLCPSMLYRGRKLEPASHT